MSSSLFQAMFSSSVAAESAWQRLGPEVRDFPLPDPLWGSPLVHRVDQVQQDRVDVGDSRVFLVRADDVVEWAEIGSEGVLADRARRVVTPATEHGARGGIVDGHVTRVSDSQDPLAGGRMCLRGAGDLEAELERLGHGVGRKAGIAAGRSDAGTPAKVPPDAQI